MSSKKAFNPAYNPVVGKWPKSRFSNPLKCWAPSNSFWYKRLSRDHLIFLVGLHIIHSIFSAIKMFAVHPLPKQLVPIVGIIASHKNMSPAASQLILFFLMGAMGAGLVCSKGAYCWCMGLFSGWSGCMDAQGVHP